MSALRVAALVPAYQAEGTVGEVVRSTAAVVSPVVVVDDGSTDGTGAAARAAGATVLRQEPNAGKGAALVAGFRALVGTGFTHAVTLDADGQHLAVEIPALLAAAQEQPCAIVVGVRRKEGQTIRRAARFGNWIADRLMTLLAGRPLPDTQSGFRVYPLAETLALGATGRRFDFETEILFRAARRRLPIVGVPVRVHYPPIAERVTHYRAWVDTLRIIRTMCRVLIGRAA